MKRKMTKLAALGLSAMLAACLLPIPPGYADDQIESGGSSQGVVGKTGDEEPVESTENPSDGSKDDAGTSSDALEPPSSDGKTPEDALQDDGASGDEGPDAFEPAPDDTDSGELPGIVEPANGDEASGSDAVPSGDANDDVDADAGLLGDESDPAERSGQEAVDQAKKEAAPVQSYAGATMFETAAAEAKAAYPDGSDSAIIVGPGDAWIDALSATGLAASRGPILFTERDALHEATRKALKELGVKRVVIIGGTAVVSAKAEQAIVKAGVKVEKRLGGEDCYDTQMKIYEYGRSKNLWDGSMAIVATASHFGDALSVSPVAFVRKAPIFLVPAGEGLRRNQQQALVKGARNGGFTSLVLVGGTAVVSKRVEGFVSGVASWNGGSYRRLAGATQYETSAAVADWATAIQGFTWDNLAFTTGRSPYDALAGSVLQGGSKSVLLLADGSNTATLTAAAQHKASIDHVRFLGGKAALPQKLRNTITSKLGIAASSHPKAATTRDERVEESTDEEGASPKAQDVQEEVSVEEDAR